MLATVLPRCMDLPLCWSFVRLQAWEVPGASVAYSSQWDEACPLGLPLSWVNEGHKLKHPSSVMSRSPAWCPPRWISHTQAPGARLFLHLQEQRRPLLTKLRGGAWRKKRGCKRLILMLLIQFQNN